MFPGDAPKLALCVAIHDVAPATWPECQRLQRALRAVADIPLTWLVVPRYHGSAMRSLACEATLRHLIADGHEVALHGGTHLDNAPPRATPAQPLPAHRLHAARRRVFGHRRRGGAAPPGAGCGAAA